MDSLSRATMSSMNPMLLQHVLRGLCSNDSQWVYGVFWRILPRNYPPPRWDMEGSAMDRSKGNPRNWILVWEDGFCNFSACASHSQSSFFTVPHLGASSSSSSNENSQQQFPEPAMSPDLFFKMSHDAYNYGEGLIGKVAIDKSHKWVYHEPLENELGYFTSWDSNIDPHPRTWEGQFKAGIQTIAVIAVDEGVLQLGSTQRIMEDLNFVLYVQRKFNFLHAVPGLLVPHPTTSSSEGPHPSPDCVSTMTTSTLQSEVTAGSSDQLLFPMKTPDPASTTSELVNWSQYSFCYSLDPAPPEALLLNGLLTIPPHAFMPSMASSLQALLSKLPNVTKPSKDNNIGGVYPSNGINMGNAHASNGNFEVSPNSGGFNDFNVSSDGSDLQKLVDGEGTAYSSVGNSAGEDGEFESQSFVAYENLMEYGIQEVLQNSDSSFTSFLNETCS